MELYDDPTVITFSTGNACDYETFWLDDVMCNGEEHAIRECSHTAWGGHNCNPAHECIMLECGGGGL